MKKIILFFICIYLFICIKVNAQDNPKEDIVLKAVKSVIAFKFGQNELQDYVRIKEEPIIFIHKSFTGLNRVECIAVCPMQRQTGSAGAYTKFVILFYKNAGGTWSKGNFSVLEDEVDIVDINNDNFYELLCKSGFAWMGESSDKTTIYQLTNDIERIIYSNESSSNSMLLNVGDEAEKIYKISIIDINNDGIKEIEESLAIGIVESLTDNEPKLFYKKKKRILKFVNGKYQ